MPIVVDPNLREIIIDVAPTNGVVEIDVVEDLYSALKEAWRTDSLLGRFIFPFDPVGGDPLTGTLAIGKYVFLRNDLGWTIRPYESESHQLIFQGNLYASDPTIPTLEQNPGLSINIVLERSQLTQQLTVTTGSGLSSAQAQQLLDLYRLSGLDPSAPLIVSDTQRDAGDISQTITEDGSTGEVVVQRV